MFSNKNISKNLNRKNLGSLPKQFLLTTLATIFNTKELQGQVI